MLISSIKRISIMYYLNEYNANYAKDIFQIYPESSVLPSYIPDSLDQPDTSKV